MNHFNFYDAFDFDDDTSMFAFQVAIAVVAKEESINQGQRTEFSGSVSGHNIINRNRKEGELRVVATQILTHLFLCFEKKTKNIN